MWGETRHGMSAMKEDLKHFGSKTRTIFVSNRSPYLTYCSAHSPRLERSIGGVPIALEGILRKYGGTWIAWSGGDAGWPSRMRIQDNGAEYSLRFVHLSKSEIVNYYHGFANQFLWPLCHCFPEKCFPSEQHWQTYKEVNRLFAGHVLDEYHSGDTVWIHDYHLSLVPGFLRKWAPQARIVVFWHIPFPPSSVFKENPWSNELLTSLLEADTIGFHSHAYAANFLDCLKEGLGLRIKEGGDTIDLDGRRIVVRALPLGVDADEFERLSSRPETFSLVDDIRRLTHADQLLLSVDRIDYTKGILERLKAVRLLFKVYPEYRKRLSLIQVAVPSRHGIPVYQRLTAEIMKRVEEINGCFSRDGWAPVRLITNSLHREQLVAHYRAADMALVTPLQDGLNLVAKEYVASNSGTDKALVLSKYAGVAEEFGEDAVVVDPRHPEGIVDGIRTALMMKRAEKQRRMEGMRCKVRSGNLFWWANQFLNTVGPGNVA